MALIYACSPSLAHSGDGDGPTLVDSGSSPPNVGEPKARGGSPPPLALAGSSVTNYKTSSRPLGANTEIACSWIAEGRMVMTASSYSRLAGAVFALVAILQLARALAGLPITIGNTSIPLWASWVACVVAAGLAWFGWNVSKT